MVEFSQITKGIFSEVTKGIFPSVGTSRILLDGVDDFVQVDASSGDYDFGTGDFAIRAYVNTPSLSGQLRIAHRWDSSSNRGFAFVVQTNGVLRCNIGVIPTTASRSIRDSVAALAANQTYEVGVFWDNSAGAITFEINGAPSNGAYIDQNGAGQSVSGTTDVFIGRTGAGAGTPSYSEGSIWDVRVYDDLAGTNLISRHLGTGAENSDWVDQVGSNDGTVNGSPVEVII